MKSVIKFFFLLISLYSLFSGCSKKCYIPKNVVTSELNYDTTITTLVNCDTLSLGLFHNTFYQLLKKINNHSAVNIFVYDNEVNYLIDEDTLIITPAITSYVGSFFRYTKSDHNKLLLFVTVKYSENDILVYVSRIKRNSSDLKELKVEMKRRFFYTYQLDESDRMLKYFKMKPKCNRWMLQFFIKRRNNFYNIEW